MPTGLEKVEIDYYIRFVGDHVPEGRVKKYYKILSKEPIQYETGRSDTAEFSAVASGANSGFKSIEILEPDDHHLVGFDWGLKDACRYHVKIPTGRDRLGIDKDMDVGFVYNLMSSYLLPNPVYGFWLVEDMYPAFDAYNDSPVSVTPKIYFYGFKFAMKEVKDGTLIARLDSFKNGQGGQPFTNLTLGGVKG